MKLTGPAAAEVLVGEVRWDCQGGRTRPLAAGSELSEWLDPPE